MARSSSSISLCQRKYALKLVNDARLLGCKPATIPMDNSFKLLKTNGVPFADISFYRRLIGRLIYLTTTRPDISYSINQLSHFLSCPTTTHHQATLRVLKYNKGTLELNLFFPSSPDMNLKAYSDSDWVGCPNTRRSITTSASILEKLLSAKNLRNKALSLVPLVKLNTKPLLPLHVNYNG